MPAPTLLRRFSVTSLAHCAHATSHHHTVRQSPHRRPPVERARPETVASAQLARGHRVERFFEHFDGRWTCAWRARPVRSDKTAKVGPVGAHPLYRGALLERWL